MKRGSIRSACDPCRHCRGMILILTLVLMGLTAALVMQAQVTASARLRLAQTRLGGALLRTALADAAQGALRRLADDDPPFTGHPSQAWAAGLDLEYPGDITVAIRMRDAHTRFDVNALASPRPGEATRIMTALLRRCDIPNPEERVEALRDWMDAGRSGRFGAAYYRERDLPQTPPDLPLESWQEILLVAGFERAFFSQRDDAGAWEQAGPSLLDYLTLLPGPRTAPAAVNINTAPEALLEIIAGPRATEWVRRIVALREQRWIDVPEALSLLNDERQARRLAPLLTGRGAHFEIIAQASGGGQEAGLRVLARRNEPDGDVAILRWLW